ncbi:MAG: PAS domain S-box protein [Coriobacteriia bacterium]|nr:PAS domain S-box protein [Coriobacteriia bacterium]
MDESESHSSNDCRAASIETSSAEASPPTPAVVAAAPPSRAEQRHAKIKQAAAEASWEPEDAAWADGAVEEEGEALFRSIFERSAVGIALIDLEGRISKCNPALAEMLGQEIDELPGRAFTDLSYPEDGALDLKYFEALVGGESDHYTIEKRYVRGDGSVLWGQMTASLISGDHELPRFVLGIIEDVSERHNAEEAVRQRDLGIREAYTQVVAAVTGGKLVLVGMDEIVSELGDEVWNAGEIGSAKAVSEARHQLGDTLAAQFNDPSRVEELVLATGEAMANAWSHGGGAGLRLLKKGCVLQVEVEDAGPGIDFANLPKATLVPGYSSTTTSLGMGFTIMLAECDRVLLATTPAGTRVVLEARYGDEDGTH